jgi:hypothetical protein
MNDQRVRALPERIRSWAGILEKVNDSPWLSPNHLVQQASATKNSKNYAYPLNITLANEGAQLFAKQFHSLPSVLRFYAAHMQAWMEVFHPTGRRRRDLGFRNAIRPRILLTSQLLELVRQSARRPCHSQIVVLLDAAYRAAGKPHVVSQDGLAKLAKNNSWLAWVIRDFAADDQSL